MLDRYRAALALTSLLLLAAAPGHHHRPAHHRHASLASPSAGVALYSRRALRRAKIILQLKLLELHELQLDRVRQALQRHIPIDRLLKEPPPTPRP